MRWETQPSNRETWCVWGRGEGEEAGCGPRGLRRSGSRGQVRRGKRDLPRTHVTVQDGGQAVPSVGERIWGRPALDP